ncbi:MAG TPA: PilZ domain-containing protein [bacterium]|nr:PilZ domain-containing protein [bacterium]
MPASPSSADKRVRPRHTVRLRVDARLITEDERVDILSGLGFPELENEGMSLTRPRRGFMRLETRDASASGLRLSVQALDGVDKGGALSLEVHLPGEGRVVRLIGDVIWADDKSGERVAGLRIAALEEEGLTRLLKALEKA